jgi:DNA-binding NtrC family response regulator
MKTPTTTSATPICLVEDDPIMGESIIDRFTLDGWSVDWHTRLDAATAAIEQQRYRIVVCDIRLPDGRADRWYEQARQDAVPLPPFLFITGHGEIDRAVTLLKLGAVDYVTKPFDLDRLVEQVEALAGPPPSAAEGEAPVLGVSPAMRNIEGMLQRLAKLDLGVLITGETGVGKEVVARRLHELCGCGPFVAVNCAALPEGLAESELFGHERGAFTGSAGLHRGVFEQATGGLLFLDEVGDMALPLQSRLLRVLQEQTVVRVGGERPVAVRVRLVCATHEDLRARVERGQFREDLYYRVNVVHVHVPPLRERREDILWLARQILADFAAEQGGAVRRLNPDAEQALLAWPWPGNVRELKHVLQRACALAENGPLTAEGLFGPRVAASPPRPLRAQSLTEYLAACERDYVARCLADHHGRMSATAAALGVTRKGLWQKLKRLSIDTRGQPEDG